MFDVETIKELYNEGHINQEEYDEMIREAYNEEC